MADTDTMKHTNTKPDGMPFQDMRQHHEYELKNHESGEEYSSGSDRSVEADNTDYLRYDPNTGETSEGTVIAARIRSKKRRHGSHGSRRHKGGSRHKHRSFQPYPDTGELETSLKRKSLELQEKENAAALLRQGGGEEQFVTFPVAPFNSTQFLMDEHSVNSQGVSKPELGSPKVCAQDVALSSMPSTPRPDDDMETVINFNHKDKEFSDIYSSIHAENLQSLPKEQLVKHYMSLEEQVALLQKKVAEAEQRSVGSYFVKSKDEVKDKESVPSSDSNSLSSGNEDFIDLLSLTTTSADTDSGPTDV